MVAPIPPITINGNHKSNMDINQNTDKGEVDILVVEDSPGKAERLKKILQECDYNFRLVTNGKDALFEAQRQEPDLIISDAVLPDMDGFEICNEIKNDESLKHIPVMLHSDSSDPGNIIRGLSVQANNFILEPFDNKNLLDKIESLLKGQSQQNGVGYQEEQIVRFDGKQHNITASSQQILSFLISTYENVIYQERELNKVQLKLEKLNKEYDENVHELESSRAELKASEEKFRSFVQMLPDFVYQIDANGHFTFVNDAVTNLGFLPEELIGKHFNTIVVPIDSKQVNRFEVLKENTIKHPDKEKTPKLFDERRTGERSTRGLEVRIIPKEGGVGTPAIIEPIGEEVPIVEISSSGLYESNIVTGKMEYIGSVGVIRDITERKQVEREIHKLNSELEQAVVERTRELNETNKNLVKTLDELNITQQQVIQSEKLASLGSMIAGTAHELNNAMTGILYCVQYVRQQVKDKKNSEILEKAEREIHRSDKIISSMLTYSRPSKREMVQVDIVVVVKRAVDLLDVYYHKKGIKVIINMQDTLPPVWANPNSLQQVFLNLLINAFDSLSESPVKEVRIDGSETDGRVNVMVKDTGPGIPAENIQKIFDPFFTTKTPGKGTGLGLSVSQNIINGFGGSLTVENAAGQGAVFLITLLMKLPAKT